jgi:hypothetical protein
LGRYVKIIRISKLYWASVNSSIAENPWLPFPKAWRHIEQLMKELNSPASPPRFRIPVDLTLDDIDEGGQADKDTAIVDTAEEDDEGEEEEEEEEEEVVEDTTMEDMVAEEEEEEEILWWF